MASVRQPLGQPSSLVKQGRLGEWTAVPPNDGPVGLVGQSDRNGGRALHMRAV